jgi:uncharacterized protein YbjT (DUF2867 family)
VTVDELDVHDPARLAQFVNGADALINLVGVLHGGHGNRGYRAAHTGLAEKAVAACRSAGVSRLLHMSALGAEASAKSAYLASKGEAEKIVRSSGLAWTLFRPSVVFGRGDSFLNLFAKALRLFPVLPLACPDARFQPVFVEDVAAAFARSLPDTASVGRAYDLCGPRAYTLRELVDYVAAVTGRKRPIIGLNDVASYAQAFAMELPPFRQVLGAMGLLMTRDNYYSMQVESVCRGPFPFDIAPTALEAVAPLYLGERTSRSRYDLFRRRARRDESVTGDE